MADFDFEDVLYGGFNNESTSAEFESKRGPQSGEHGLIELSASDIDRSSVAPSRYLEDDEDLPIYRGSSHEGPWEEDVEENEDDYFQEIYVLVCGSSSRGDLEDFKMESKSATMHTYPASNGSIHTQPKADNSSSSNVTMVEVNAPTDKYLSGGIATDHAQRVRMEGQGRPEKISEIAEHTKAHGQGILMEWQLHNERPWLRTADSSAWFNYGFNETNFREWLNQQIRLRHEKLREHLQSGACR